MGDSVDDALAPGILRQAAVVMDRHPNVGMVYGPALVFSNNEDAVARQTDKPKSSIIPGRDFLERCCLNGCFLASPSAVVRTSLQHEIGGLDPRFPLSSDLEMWMRISTRADVAAIDSVQSFYRRHASNMSNVYDNIPTSDLKYQFDTSEMIFREWAGHMPDARAMLDAQALRTQEQVYWRAGVALEFGNIEGYRQCLEFARSIGAKRWGSPGWRRLMLKRIIGRRLIALIRRLEPRLEDGPAVYNPYVIGELFGWMPDEGYEALQPDRGRQALWPAQTRRCDAQTPCRGV